MKFWQVAVLVIAIALLAVVTLRFMPSTLSVTRESEWLAVIIFGFIAVPGVITAGLIYGIWKLGDRGES